MNKSMTVGNLIQSWNCNLLTSNSVRLDIELLLSQVLHCNKIYLYTHWDQLLNKKQMKQFQSLFNLRKIGIPMAYILEKKEFYGYDFFVKSGVFIPRPETETLVSSILSQLNHQEELNIIDFGCGSGCIGLSLLAFFLKAQLISVDINTEALQVSKINAKKRGMTDRVIFLNKNVSDLDKETLFISTPVDLIVANPPYIAFNDNRVEKDVVFFEPPEALFSGERGMYHIHSWLKVASHLLKPGGMYFFEVGVGQDISSLKCTINKMRKKAMFKDLSGQFRVVQYQKCYG